MTATRPSAEHPQAPNGTERVPEIAVPARHRQHASGKEHPRALDEAIFHRTGDSKVAAAHIAQRRKATVERVTQHLGGVTGHVGQRLGLRVGDSEAGREHMAVRVDQSGHQGLAADIDHLPRVGRIRLSLHRHDAIVVDDDRRFVQIVGSDSVENSRIDKARSRHVIPPRRQHPLRRAAAPSATSSSTAPPTTDTA